MLERTQIQSSGFRNIGPQGAPNGFQLRLRQPNYRGVRISLIEGIDIEVDGERFASENSRFIVDGREISHAEMVENPDVRWPVGGCVTVIIDKAGGLVPGVYEVSSVIRFRHPYFPPRFQPISVPDKRHITIIF